MTGNGVTWNYTYDAGGMRTGHTNGTTTYSYVYNGGRLSQMTVGSDTLRFAYDASGTPMTVTYNGTAYYYVTNLQGDVIALLNSSGTTVVGYTYDAWGNPLTVTETLASTLGTLNPLRYRGYVYDTKTGLYYLHSRYYDPEIGRFLNADNYPSTGQGLTSHNMFAYCGNNPVSCKDDGGEFWNIVAGAVIGGLLSAATQIVSNLVTGEKWNDGVLKAAATGAVSDALSATGIGVVGQALGNAAIGVVSEAIDQAVSGNLDTREGMMAVAAAGTAGFISRLIGGNGMRHKTGNYYKAAQSAKDTALKVFGKTYGNPKTPAKLLSRAIKMVNTVGYQESGKTELKFFAGCVSSQLIAGSVQG